MKTTKEEFLELLEKNKQPTITAYNGTTPLNSLIKMVVEGGAIKVSLREVPAGVEVVFTEKLTLHELGLETTVVVGESGNKYELPTKHLQLKEEN